MDDNFEFLLAYIKESSYFKEKGGGLRKAVIQSDYKEVMTMLRLFDFPEKEREEALRKAAGFGDMLMVKLFLDDRKYSVRGKYGALIDAVESGNRDTALLLIRDIGEWCWQDGEGESLLHHIARASEDPDLISYAVQKGLDVNLKGNRGKTPLMYSILSVELLFDNFYMEVSGELLEAGADVNVQDEDGTTVLMMACTLHNYVTGGGEEMAVFLQMCLDYGADVNLRNKDGFTAREIAEECGFEEGVEALTQVVTIPSTDVRENTNAGASKFNLPPTSFLSENGYRAIFSRKKRWEALEKNIFPSYTPQEVVEKITTFLRRYKGQWNGSVRYKNVIEEWEYDLRRIHDFFSEL